jgi:mRNA interferase HigB
VALHIISVSTLKAFWEKYPDAEGPLKAWYSEIKKASYQNPNEVIADYATADTVKSNRIVFNICHNKYLSSFVSLQIQAGLCTLHW